MIEVDRDPRVNPVAGDEIGRYIAQSLDGYIIRYVEDVRGGGDFVFLTADNGFSKRRRIVPIEKWRAWARSAEVLKKGSTGE